METYKRKNKQSYKNIDRSSIVFFVPYWIISFLLVIVAFVMLSLLYILTPLPGEALPYVTKITVAAVEVFAAYIIGKYTRFPAVFAGALYGAVFTMAMLVIGLITFSLSMFSLKFLFVLLTGIAFGALGSIVGSNDASKRKRRRRRTF